MRPERDDIAAPELPGGLRWHGSERAPRMSELTAAGPVLVHFFDFAQLNSVRALPYAIEWDRRYRRRRADDARDPLAAVLVHRPARGPRPGARAARGRPPGRRRFRLRRSGTTMAAGAGPRCSSGAGAGRCAGLISARASTAPPSGRSRTSCASSTRSPRCRRRSRRCAPATLPAPSSPRRPKRSFRAARRAIRGAPSERGTALELGYEAGGAHASVDGEGELRLLLDRKAERSISVPAPGLFELAVHPRHERHRLRIFVGEGVDLYSVSFSAGVP